jgi:hypothetical protein
MKKLATYLFMAVLTIAAVNANAQNKNEADENQSVTIRLNDEKMVEFNAGLQKGQKRIHYVFTIQTEAGDKVYGETIVKKRAVSKKYDISKLPVGIYVIEVRHNLKPVCQMKVNLSIKPAVYKESLVVERI